MDSFLEEKQEKKGFNPVFLIGALIGIVAIGIAIWLLSFKPSMEEQTAKIMAGAYKEGSPEFADLNKDIIISTDDSTVQSPMGLGTISMFIDGKIRNKGTKNITVLEVNVAVITQFNEVLREKRILVIPNQQHGLAPGEMIPIHLTMDGFKKDDDRANIRWKVTAIKDE